MGNPRYSPIKALVPLFIDIETTFTRRPDLIEAVTESVKPPGSMKKPETIAKWEAEQRPAKVQEALSSMALDGATAEISAIGWAVGNDPVQVIAGDEPGALKALFEIPTRGDDAMPVLVGHNHVTFDIPRIIQRSIVNRMKMPAWFPRWPKPWDSRVFDTMLKWAGDRGHIGLDRLLAALYHPDEIHSMFHSDTIPSSEMPQAARDGNWDAVVHHCREDVRKLRVAYYAMKEAGL